MAYFVEQAQTGGTGAISAVAMNLPAHQANDILVAHITVDSGTITVGGSSWAALPSAPTNPVTQGTISYLYYVKAAGSSETLTLTTGDAYTCGIYCFRDVDGTTPFDGVTPKHAGVGTGTSTPVNESVTTSTADALVVFHIAYDGTTPQVLSDPGVMSIYNADSTGTTATTSSHQAAAWYIQRSTGATPVANWSSSVSAVYVRATYTLRNASGGQIPAYIDDSTSPGTRLTCGHHVSTLNNISYAASGSFNVTANINGKTLTQGTAANGADFGINPYTNAVTSTAAATAATALVGPELVLTGGRDLSTGLICGSFIAGTPKMGAFGLGTINNGGVVVRVASGTNNWNAYQVAAKNSVPNPVQRCVFAIQAGYDGSDYDTGSSGSASAASITYVQFLRNAPYFSSTVYMSELHQVKTQIVAGGDSNNPVDVDGMDQIGQSFRLPIIQKVGAAGLLSFAPIQIGGGDAVNFQIDAGSLQFPRRADTLKKELQYHAADNTLGISYAGKSGDVVKHTNSLISSPTPYYWEINSSATSAATWDFSGTSIIGANVTLRNVTTFDSMSFTSCPTLVFSGCTVTNSNISAVPSGNDTLTTNASTNIDNSTINVTGVSSGNRWCSVADPTIFSGCSFTGLGSTGHAIRITATGTYNLVGNTFTGFGSTGTNNAAIFNDSGGAVTLNISGGGSTPTYRNGTSASTTVNNTVDLNVTVLDSNNGPIPTAQVAIYKVSDDSQIMNEDTRNITAGSFVTGTVYRIVTVGTTDFTAIGAASNTVGVVFTASGTGSGNGTATDGLATEQFNFATNTPIYVRVRKSSSGETKYVPVSTTGTITSSGYNLTVTLQADTIA